MAGERLPRHRSSDSSSSAEIAGARKMLGDGSMIPNGGRGRALNDEAGHTGKGGKLRLSRPALFKKKPYDRPILPGSMGHALSSGLNGPRPSLPARIVDSASYLITSTASYLFESFFKRRQTLWIGNGIRSTARMDSADIEPKEGSKPLIDNVDKKAVTPLEGPVLEAHHEKVEGEDLDLAKVEGILKKQLLSREEVRRLTDVLQNWTHGAVIDGSNSEPHRWQEKSKQGGGELNPVELAKEFMGGHTSLRVAPKWQSTRYQYGEVAGPSAMKRFKEVYERSSGQASKAHPASAERMRKRRLIADDEDDCTRRGPTRRVRQRMTIKAYTSPYIRQVTMLSRPLQTCSMPLLHLTNERMEKVEEALEESMLAAKGKAVEEPAIVVACDDADPPESSKARDKLETLCEKDSLVLPTLSDIDNSSCKPAVEPVVTVISKVAEESVAGSLAESPPKLPVIVPERTKGFHMSAFFEDSSSDEDSGPPVKALTSSEAQGPGLSSSQGALQENIKKQPSALVSNDGSFSSIAADSAKMSSPPLLQPSIASGPSDPNSNTFPVASSLAVHSSDPYPSTLASTLATGKSFPNIPVVSNASSATEKEFLPFKPPPAAGVPSSVKSSMSPISASLSVPTPLLATSVPFSVQGEIMAAVAPSSSSAKVESPSSMQKEAAAEVVAAEASGVSPMAASPPVVTRVSETAGNVVTPATASKLSVALFTTPESVSHVGSVVSSAALPSIVPVVFQADVGRAQADSAMAADSFLKAGSGVTFASGSPGADRQGDGDTMATDPMTEEPESSFVASSMPSFLFGSASTAPLSIGQTPSFGSNGASSSPFSFNMPSTAPSEASSSAQFPLSSQSSSAVGQSFTFGGSGTSSSNPFSANTQSSFSFESSAATSASPVFAVTSSAPLTFPATPAVPSFSFGTPAASSSSTSSTSMFGSQMTPTSSGFGGQSNASPFVFSTPPTSSGTPTPPTFQFGGAGASGPAFGGQSFTFRGQPAPMAGNPFAQSGPSNTAPFQFGSSAVSPSQSVFSSGAAPSIPFGAAASSTPSFGGQPSGSPFPFTFGAQAAAPPTGQPFSFVGQPSAAGQSPFASPGATGMDFGGGFSLGAAGGERPGRKFIKAKRIGGLKRGK